uniref:CHD_buttress n=1 Tax=synthetic construct TaxID=32630 RepID=UPI003467EF2C
PIPSAEIFEDFLDWYTSGKAGEEIIESTDKRVEAIVEELGGELTEEMKEALAMARAAMAAFEKEGDVFRLASVGATAALMVWFHLRNIPLAGIARAWLLMLAQLEAGADVDTALAAAAEVLREYGVSEELVAAAAAEARALVESARRRGLTPFELASLAALAAARLLFTARNNPLAKIIQAALDLYNRTVDMSTEEAVEAALEAMKELGASEESLERLKELVESARKRGIELTPFEVALLAYYVLVLDYLKKS